MYDYIERVVAPRQVEFYVPTPQGHRIVRVFLDHVNPRITAFNETSSTRTPATLYWQEIKQLIEKAADLLGIEVSDPQFVSRKEQANEDR